MINGKVYISSVEVRVEEDKLWVILDVIETPESLAKKDLKERLESIRKYLSKIVGEPVHLRIRYLPVQILDYEISAPTTENE